MRGRLHAGMFPLTLAGGVGLVVLARFAAAVAANPGGSGSQTG
jgi:hypothetical protein